MGTQSLQRRLDTKSISRMFSELFELTRYGKGVLPRIGERFRQPEEAGD
jgi:hypothetical protein